MATNYTYDYFISYRRKSGGSLSARDVKTILCKYGKKVFLDVDDIKKGEYVPQIYNAIENSKEFIMILNEESWREKEKNDVYYDEIIRITQQSGDITPIEFAKDVLLNIPVFLRKQLKRDITKFEKISYMHDMYFDFEGKLCNKLNLEKQVDLIPHFSLPFQIDDLIPRDEKADILCAEIIKFRILNLIGVEGSGKTSLMYLMVERYKEQFNNIIYIKIANKIQDDFISQINATLKLPFKDKNTDVKFRQIISYIEKYYKEGNNLLILDIDNTADKEDISLCINANNLFITNKLFLSNWRVLILSSEKFGVFQSVLLDNQDKEFLKKIFLRKTGERYEQFEHFDDLFKLVNYNTLLTEQLAFYLKSLPIQSLDEIKNIVYKYSFDKKTDGINAQDREKIKVYGSFCRLKKSTMLQWVILQAENNLVVWSFQT